VNDVEILSKSPPKTHNSFGLHLIRKIIFYDLDVREKNLNDCLSKSPHVALPYFGVRALKFADDVKALRQLCKHIDDRV
jgi:hypothetical protein